MVEYKRFFKADRRVLLDASAWPLLCGYCGVEVFYFQFATKIHVYSAIELLPIVGYNQLGYSEPAHNILPYELNNLVIFDGCEDFGFYPFTEIIGGN